MLYRKRRMRSLIIDPFSGISGDMFLGALFSLGVSPTSLEKKIKKGGIKGFQFEVKEVVMNGIKAQRVKVKGGERKVFATVRDLKKYISTLKFSEYVLKKLKEAMEEVFRIERKIHGKSQVHEIGELDTLIDIVGAIFGVESLGIEKIYTFPVNVGSGFINSSHGLLPIPAPLTLELLRGYEVFSRGNGELTTPTGALILKIFSAKPVSAKRFTPLRVGYGAGNYSENPFPDLLRLWLCEERKDEVMVIEANIDDMSPEFFQPLFDALFSAGAIDVFVGYGVMKKGRPGFLLSVLCEPENMEKVVEAIFRNSTTIGVRYYSAGRVELGRTIERKRTRYGSVRVKRGFYCGDEVNFSFEYSDLKKLSQKTGKTPKEILMKLST